MVGGDRRSGGPGQGTVARVRAVGPELVGFAAVGLCAYAADLGLFVWLRGPVGMGPISAKALSFVAGCSVAYLGNSLGTYRRRAAGVSRLRQYGVFFAVNVAGALVQLLCIAVSHYGLGFTSPRADTISGAGVGMVLATVLRFWGTRTLVFRSRPDGVASAVVPNAMESAERGRLGSWTG
ncbi:GtrA family protein [Streptomyces sp. NPDC050145]|uniref:GtrA family protein n=1 Tax=Streptomyces sp. NPDC050145 TaxID=3365602 RepID=UPI00379E2566